MLGASRPSRLTALNLILHLPLVVVLVQHFLAKAGSVGLGAFIM